MRGADIMEDYEEVDHKYDGSLFVGRSYKENPMAYDDISSVVPANRKQSTLQSSDVSDASPVDFYDELLIANLADISLQENGPSEFAVEFDGNDVKDKGMCSDMNDVGRRQLICCSDDIESVNSINIKVCEKSLSCEHSTMSPCIKNTALIHRCYTGIASLETSNGDCRPTVKSIERDTCVPHPVDYDCVVRPTRHNDSTTQHLSISNSMSTAASDLKNKLPKDKMLLTSVDELLCSSSNENLLHHDRELLQPRPSNR